MRAAFALVYKQPLCFTRLHLPVRQTLRSISTMSEPVQKAPNGAADKKAKDADKKEIRILMLHGYTQSGPAFRSKTRALEKLVAKTLAPFKLVPVLIYPTAPNRLAPRDIPGYTPAAAPATADDGDEHPSSTAGADEEPEIDAWGWFRKDDASDQYVLLEEGFATLAAAIREGAGEQGIDGVIGFSQGGALAAMLAAALERDPADPAKPARQPPAGPSPEYDWGWVEAVRAANGGRPLRFAVVYSGFFATPPPLAWLYEPKIRTPTLQFLGSLDTVVEESRSMGLAERCVDPVVVVHPGGHYVPVKREWVMPLAGFIKEHCLDPQPAL